MSQAFPVNDIPRFAVAAATTGQKVLTIPFPFLANEDIRIVKTAVNGTETELARPANFTLTGRGNPAGGSATLVAAAKAGEIYLIVGNTIPTRAENVTRGGKFSSAAIDEDLDRLTLMVQEARRDIGQAFRAPFGLTPGKVEIGAAGTLPMWDLEGNLVKGPSAAALEAVDVALGVKAGRALIHGEGEADPYEAGGRALAGLADGIEADEAVTRGQLDALTDVLDPEGLVHRVDKLETGWVTGDVKFTMDPLAQPGWIEGNGLTIGSATSNASGRAHADTADLFAFFWHASRRAIWGIQIFTAAGAPTTFGASAAADFAADKRLQLPDIGKRFPRTAGVGLDVGTLQANQNKEHNHSASTGSAGEHSHLFKPHSSRHGANDRNPGSNFYASNGDTTGSAGTPQKNTDAAGSHTHSVTVNSSGGEEARPDSVVLRGLIRL